ncbi:hypothetical protein LOK49_LG06G01312 [Camellia lanceoleosa]|uniref:Uncharacterized protein n=1 Tax=Camellia lanceoleosa TaxID=1840588 RepID=A0ACC0HAU3_9ERIC|nr:hypothetical protein LOK49_LG06G01312 [Camellia lanceoleosa]
MTGKDTRIRETDLPERMRISEESTGSPPTDEMSIEKESNWIYNQLMTGMIPLFSKRVTETTQGECELSINKDDIMRFLEFMHVQKLDVSFIAMYRREDCLSLFSDPEQNENDIKNQSKPDQKPTMRWHKVLWAIQDLDRKWFTTTNSLNMRETNRLCHSLSLSQSQPYSFVPRVPINKFNTEPSYSTEGSDFI